MDKDKRPYISKKKVETPLVEDTAREVEVSQLQSVSFFLDRTSESIKRATSMIQELESEIARLRYELMATENEYRNLQHANQEFERDLLASQEGTVTTDV